MVRPRGPKQKPGKALKPKTGKRSRRRRYHHGNLREALIEATLRLIEESGPEHVTVRAAATRAGVSSGAPFRHFPTRTALLTAVAEQAMARFRWEIATALDQAADAEPLARFAALGTAYLRWAGRNPAHFRVISDRSLVDLDSSESLRRDNAEIRDLMEHLVAEAQRGGTPRTEGVTLAPVAARALVYGLARMYVDGQLAEWDGEPQAAERQMEATLHLFAESLRRTAGGSDRPTVTAIRSLSPRSDPTSSAALDRPTVRPVAPGDHDAWAAMRADLWPDERAQDHVREVDRLLASGPSDRAAAFVAEDPSGSLLGFVEMSVRGYAEGCETTRVGFVEGWYVLPGVRRSGVGRALIDAGIAWAKERGCTEFASDAVIDNHVSHAAHKALGFEEVERIVCFKLGGEGLFPSVSEGNLVWESSWGNRPPRSA